VFVVSLDYKKRTQFQVEQQQILMEHSIQVKFIAVDGSAL